jgi:hypothetical protein
MNEEIRVTFGGDLGPLGTALRGMKGMVDKAATSIKDSFKDVFHHLTAPLSIAGAFEAVRGLMEDVKNIKRISESTGLDTGVTQDLLNLGKASGVASDAIESMLDKFVKGLAPGSDPADALSEIADKMASISDPTERARLATDAFGKSGAKLIPILSQGAEGVAKLSAEWGKLDDVQIAQVEHANQTLEKAGSKSKVYLASVLEGAKATGEKLMAMPWWKKIALGPLTILKAAREQQTDNDISGEQPDIVSATAKKTPAEKNTAKIEAGIAAAKKIAQEEEYLFAKPQEKVLTLTRQILALRREIADTTDPDEQVKLGQQMVDLEGKRKSITESIAVTEKTAAEKRLQLSNQLQEAQKNMAALALKNSDTNINAQYGTLQEVSNSGYSVFRHNQWEWQSSPLSGDAQQAEMLDARAHRERLFGNQADAEADESLSAKIKKGLEDSGAIAPTITEHLKAIRDSNDKMQANVAGLEEKISTILKVNE